MIHENKCADGKSVTGETRIKSSSFIQTLHDKIRHKTSLKKYMIRATKIRWLTYKEDLEHCELWDKKKEINVVNMKHDYDETFGVKCLLDNKPQQIVHVYAKF